MVKQQTQKGRDETGENRERMKRRRAEKLAEAIETSNQQPAKPHRLGQKSSVLPGEPQEEAVTVLSTIVPSTSSEYNYSANAVTGQEVMGNPISDVESTPPDQDQVTEDDAAMEDEEEIDDDFSVEESEVDSEDEDLDDISSVELTPRELWNIESGGEEDYIRERKKDKKRMREEKRKEQEYDNLRKAKVKAAMAILKKRLEAGEHIPAGPIEGDRFDLYSAEYFDHYYVEVHRGKNVVFGKIFQDLEGFGAAICDPDQLSAEVHIYPEGHLNVLTFEIPTSASLVPTVIKTFEGYELEATFLGNGFLVLSIDLNLVMKGKPTMHGKAEKLNFYGIWQSKEERKHLMEEAWRRARRPSPRDSVGSQLGRYSH
ncbi:hypothetical protein H2200_010149 [Cladophialophora chaetospira]|uniref:Uncharacterized protein n=1 Tax=Cladophialophora chaetospira TaxID=386627 RepID=A0AA38X2J4_9EURO|nr:hypothetical protein H2200_010149 [Cladophialophora chaetospira]